MPSRLNIIIKRQVDKFLVGNAETLTGDVCTISRMQGSPKVLTPVYTNEPCNVEDLAPGSNPGLAEITELLNAKKLIVRSTTTLMLGDQVQHAGHTYEIFAVNTDRTPNLQSDALMQLVSI